MELTQTETKDIIYTQADLIRLERRLKERHRSRCIELCDGLGSRMKAKNWMRENLAYTPEGSRKLSKLIEADHASFALLSSMVTEARNQNAVESKPWT